jgi:hypothetical protein
VAAKLIKVLRRGIDGFSLCPFDVAEVTFLPQSRQSCKVAMMQQ